MHAFLSNVFESAAPRANHKPSNSNHFHILSEPLSEAATSVDLRDSRMTWQTYNNRTPPVAE
eukprot:3621701-Amphidinium_carterae.1